MLGVLVITPQSKISAPALQESEQFQMRSTLSARRASNHAEGGGQFYDNGPIWRVELTSPVWDRQDKPVKGPLSKNRHLVSDNYELPQSSLQQRAALSA
jgi:hypothetical protein